MKHAEERYRKRGEQTSEVHIVPGGSRLAGRLRAAAEFTAADLEAVRSLMIDYKSDCKHRAGNALSRPTINTYVSRIIRAFDRAFDRASIRQSIPPTVPAALAKLPGLREGESDVPEPPKVESAEFAPSTTIVPLPIVIRVPASIGLKLVTSKGFVAEPIASGFTRCWATRVPISSKPNTPRS